MYEDVSLKQIGVMIEELKKDLEHYEELKEKFELSVLPKSIPIKEDVIQSSFCGDKMLDYVINIEDVLLKIDCIKDKIEELTKFRTDKIKLINQEKAMIDRIIYMKEHNSTLTEIAEATGYSVSTIRRLLKEFYENVYNF